jgi:hypothetical protein
MRRRREMAKRPRGRGAGLPGAQRFRDIRDIAARRRYHLPMGVNDELRDRLRLWFGEFNAQFFSGKLPEHEIRVEWLGGTPIIVTLRSGRVRPYTPHGSYYGLHIAEENLIYVGSQCATMKDAFIREVLLHEMCHAEVYRNALSPLLGDPHGSEFIAELHRLIALGESWAIDEAEYYQTVPIGLQGNFPLDAWRAARAR